MTELLRIMSDTEGVFDGALFCPTVGGPTVCQSKMQKSVNHIAMSKELMV